MPKVAELIGKKDFRAARKWCEKNNVKIHRDSSGPFVYINDFNLVYDYPLIAELKRKYKENWIEAYSLYNNNELFKSVDFKSDIVKAKKSNTVQNGSFAEKFRNKFGP